MSKIKLNNVRLSFPSLFRKAVFNGEETKFEATFLLNKKEHADTIAEINAAIKEMIKDSFKGAKIPSDKLCMKDGGESAYDGYEGCVSIKSSNNKRPTVLDRDRSPLSEDDNRIYSGCYVNAVIDLWPQNNSYGKRINSNLLGVQFMKDGEPFGAGGQTAGADDFEDFGDAEMEDFI